MSKVVIGITMSLDGFINDPVGSVELLYPDLAGLRETAYMKESIATTGAVVMGRRTYDMAEDPDWYVDYEYQVPIFVLTHRPPARPPKEGNGVTFTFVTDGAASAVAQARKAAGSRDVNVFGTASLLPQILSEGLADELHVDVMPLLLGGGLRAFEAFEGQPVRLKRLAVTEVDASRTHLRYQIVK